METIASSASVFIIRIMATRLAANHTSGNRSDDSEGHRYVGGLTHLHPLRKRKGGH